jgi:transcriptional regulator with XRE-family HTH domain
VSHRGPADAEAIGAKLRLLRAQKGVSMRWLASRMNVSYPFLCDIEHGRRRLSAARAVDAARALNVDPDEILMGLGFCPHCKGSGRAEDVPLPARPSGILLPGWFCGGCGVFNGEAKEKHYECRSCGWSYLDSDNKVGT